MLCVVGLAMNRSAKRLIGDVARRFFDSANQLSVLQNIDSSCGLLGLCGLLLAFKSDGLLASMQKSQMEPVFHLLHIYFDGGAGLAGLTSDVLGDVDILGCIAEIISVCFQDICKRDISIKHLNWTFFYILKNVHTPGVTPAAAAILEQPNPDILRWGSVVFVAQSEPRIAKIGTRILSNAFYEAVRLENTNHRVFSENALRLTKHFDAVSAENGQGIHLVVHALLRRITESNMLGWLLVLITRASSTGAAKRWRGMKIGYIVQFWGEHIIQWGRQMLRESESSCEPKRLQEFLTSNKDIKDQFGDASDGAMELRNLLWQEIS